MHLLGRIFILVDLRDFFSDLGSGGMKKINKKSSENDQLHLFVCFVALRPKSAAMVIAGQSVHLTTLFSWASLNKQLTSNRAHTFACN